MHNFGLCFKWAEVQTIYIVHFAHTIDWLMCVLTVVWHFHTLRSRDACVWFCVSSCNVAIGGNVISHFFRWCTQIWWIFHLCSHIDNAIFSVFVHYVERELIGYSKIVYTHRHCVAIESVVKLLVLWTEPKKIDQNYKRNNNNTSKQTKCR